MANNGTSLHHSNGKLDLNVSYLSFKSKNVAQCGFPHIFVSMVASDERFKLENTKVSTCNLTRHLLVSMVFRLLLPRGLSESTLTVCSCVAFIAGAVVRSMSLSTLKGKSKNTLTLKKKVEVI